jgi:Spy/CpxP family protein refolding chaperone
LKGDIEMKKRLHHNKMLILLTIVMLVFGLMNIALAEAERNRSGERREDRPQGPPSIEEIVEIMTKRLSLTEDQATEIEEILKEDKEKLDELRVDTEKTREEKREAHEEIRKASDEEIMELLTDEQKEEFEKMKEERKERRENRRERRKDARENRRKSRRE